MARMIWNERFFTQVMKSGEVRGLVSKAADGAVRRGKSIAPVYTGAYRAGIHKELHTGAKRAYAYVFSDVDHSLFVESYHGTMAKALEGAKL